MQIIKFNYIHPAKMMQQSRASEQANSARPVTTAKHFQRRLSPRRGWRGIHSKSFWFPEWYGTEGTHTRPQHPERNALLSQGDGRVAKGDLAFELGNNLLVVRVVPPSHVENSKRLLFFVVFLWVGFTTLSKWGRRQILINLSFYAWQA